MGSNQSKQKNKVLKTDTNINLDIPMEIKMEIFTFLDLPSLCKASLVCKEFFEFSNQNRIYQNLLWKDYRIKFDQNAKTKYINKYQFKGTFSGWGSQNPNPNRYINPFGVTLTMSRFNGKNFKGDLNWTIDQNIGTVLIQGELDRKYSELKFTETHSFREDFLSAGANFSVRILKNNAMIGNWINHKSDTFKPYGAFLVLSDEYKKNCAPNSIKINSNWSGIIMVDLNSSMGFRGSFIKIENFEETELVIKLTTFAVEPETLKFKKVSKRKFVKVGEENSFLYIYDEVILVALFGDVFSLGCFFIE
jgi:hypothetical protein